MTGPFGAYRVNNHTLTISVNEIHNVISIDRITPGNTPEKAEPITKIERHDEESLETDSTW